MCDDTTDEEWTPFYLVNLDRFPGIDRHVYGYMEYCPDCTETRIRLINPQDVPVVDDRSEKQSVSPDEPERSWTEDGEYSGRDLTDPDDLVG